MEPPVKFNLPLCDLDISFEHFINGKNDMLIDYPKLINARANDLLGSEQQLFSGPSRNNNSLLPALGKVEAFLGNDENSQVHAR